MRIIPFLAGLAAVAAAVPAAAAEFADPGDIDLAVTQFTGAPIGAEGGARLPVDRRLKLARCEAPLAIEWYGKDHGTVQVRCPVSGGWHLFVPVAHTSPEAAGQPVVARGETVAIIVQGRGFTLSRQGEALDGGAIDDWIRVRPAGAKADSIRAKIIEPGKVGMNLP